MKHQSCLRKQRLAQMHGRGRRAERVFSVMLFSKKNYLKYDLMSQLSKLKDISDSIKAWATQREPSNMSSIHREFQFRCTAKKTILKANNKPTGNQI